MALRKDQQVTVSVVSARSLYDTNVFSKMDPYVKVTMGGQIYKTRTAKNQGKTPTWNQTFTFDYVGESTIRFQVFDNDVMSDDYIGMADVALLPILSSPGRTYASEIELSRDKGKFAGNLRATIQFSQPSNSAATTPISPSAPPYTPTKIASPAPQFHPPTVPDTFQPNYGYTPSSVVPTTIASPPYFHPPAQLPPYATGPPAQPHYSAPYPYSAQHPTAYHAGGPPAYYPPGHPNPAPNNFSTGYPPYPTTGKPAKHKKKHKKHKKKYSSSSSSSDWMWRSPSNLITPPVFISFLCCFCNRQEYSVLAMIFCSYFSHFLHRQSRCFVTFTHLDT